MTISQGCHPRRVFWLYISNYRSHRYLHAKFKKRLTWKKTRLFSFKAVVHCFCCRLYSLDPFSMFFFACLFVSTICVTKRNAETTFSHLFVYEAGAVPCTLANRFRLHIHGQIVSHVASIVFAKEIIIVSSHDAKIHENKNGPRKKNDTSFFCRSSECCSDFSANTFIANISCFFRIQSKSLTFLTFSSRTVGDKSEPLKALVQAWLDRKW